MQQMKIKFPDRILPVYDPFFASRPPEDRALGGIIDRYRLELSRQPKNDEAVKREKLIIEVTKDLKTLSEFLLPYNTEDQVIVMHKQDRKDVSPAEQYYEINQAVLKNFIKVKVFGLNEIQDLSPEQERECTNLIKAYNLQFRLNIYLELLRNVDAIVNYTNLQKDLEWFTDLAQRINADFCHYQKDQPTISYIPGGAGIA